MDLRSLTQNLFKSLPTKRATYPFSLLHPGIPKGALSEISGASGSGKSELVLRFLAENPELRIAWIEKDFSAYPCAFPQSGVSLDRVLFSESGSSAIWTAHQCLRSRLFDVVLLAPGKVDEIDLRRLQLAAEKSQCSVILMTEAPLQSGTWPLSLQLHVIDRCLEILKGPGIRHAIGR